jgi:hypothetical protein
MTDIVDIFRLETSGVLRLESAGNFECVTGPGPRISVGFAGAVRSPRSRNRKETCHKSRWYAGAERGRQRKSVRKETS